MDTQTLPNLGRKDEIRRVVQAVKATPAEAVRELLPEWTELFEAVKAKVTEQGKE